MKRRWYISNLFQEVTVASAVYVCEMVKDIHLV